MKKDTIQTRKRKPKGGMKNPDTPLSNNVAHSVINNNNNNITNNNNPKLEPGELSNKSRSIYFLLHANFLNPLFYKGFLGSFIMNLKWPFENLKNYK